MRYLVGDLQGCCTAFQRLLQHIDFSPSRDHVTVLGDLVNRGPESLLTLRQLRDMGSSAACLLGNHDLNLLAVAHGVRRVAKGDTIAEILDAPDRGEWIAWLRHKRLAIRHEDGWLLVHAGVPPSWSADDTLARAAEVESRLTGDDLPGLVAQMYGNSPSRWDDALDGADRLRFIVNALTRMRYVDATGAIELQASGPPDQAPAGLVPWFDAPGRITQGVPIAFGHWSALGLVDRPDLLSLDTGCVWGGLLTAARVDGGRREILQVVCDQVRKPG